MKGLVPRRYVVALVAVLLMQSAGYYAAEFRHEDIPAVKPLSSFPVNLQGWTTVQEYPVEKEVLDVLRADDTLSRLYLDPSHKGVASLFIAFFKTQRTGQSPHSPKNCLPGSGWEPTETGLQAVDFPGTNLPAINVNRYVVARGDEKSVVLYWYHSHSRVIAGELSAKFWLVADSIRYHRSDTSLVRVVVPVRSGDTDTALYEAVEFVRVLFPAMEKQLPL